MPLFFFDVTKQGRCKLDQVGRYLPDLGTAESAARQIAWSELAVDPVERCSIEVRHHGGLPESSVIVQASRHAAQHA